MRLVSFIASIFSNFTFTFFISLFFISIFSFSPSLYAQLQISPTKVFLDQSRRSTSIVLRNPTQEPLRYRIGVVYFHQDEKGLMKMIEGVPDGEDSLREYIRFSPRMVNLDPGETQTLRMTLRQFSSLKDGDYRAHLRFEPIATPFADEPEVSSGQLSMRLNVQIATSIPVFFRKGIEADYEIALNDLKVEVDPDSQEPRFRVRLKNNGKNFPYGDFILYTLDGENKRVKLAQVHGVQSFVPEREFVFPIRSEQDWDRKIQGNTFRLELLSTREQDGGVIAHTQAEL